MPNNFPPSIHTHLKYYVYVYIDPRTQQIFYVGKGKGDRCFAHLSEVAEKEKNHKISEIRAKGLEPQIEIVIHGIEDSQTAQRIEASIIDCIGMDTLTNIQHGYHAKQYGRMSIQQILATYQASPAQVKHPVLAFRINATFRYGLPALKLYDYTRHSWVLSERRNKAQYAFAVYRGIVQEVYTIQAWLPQNSTMNSKEYHEIKDHDINTKRWEFVGDIAPQDVREMYLLKDVSSYLTSKQNPCTYINC